MSLPKSIFLPRPPLRYVEDELPVTVVATAIDDETSIPIVQSPYSRPVLSVQIDEIGSQLAYFYSEQEDDHNKQVESLPWLARPFLSDEIGSQLSYFYLEQEEPWISQVEVIPWQPVWFIQNEEVPVLGIDQEESYTNSSESYTNSSESLLWLARPFTYDEVGSQLSYFYLEQEEPWIAQSQSIVWFGSSFIQIEEIALILVDDERSWSAQTETQPWCGVSFLDEVVGVQLYSSIDDESVWSYQTQLISRLSTSIVIDEDRPTGGIDQEESYINSLESLLWLSRPFLDDEVRQTSPCLEQEDTQTPQTQLSAWVVTLYVEENFSYTPLVPLGVSDDAFALSLPMPSYWQSVLVLDDEAFAYRYSPPNLPPAPPNPPSQHIAWQGRTNRIVAWQGETNARLTWGGRTNQRLTWTLSEDGSMLKYDFPVRASTPQLLTYTFLDETRTVIDLTNFFTVVVELSNGGLVPPLVLAASFSGSKTLGVVQANESFPSAGIWQAQFVCKDSFGNRLEGEPIQVRVVSNIDDLTGQLLSY